MEKDEISKNEIQKEIMKTDLPINNFFPCIILDSETEMSIHTTVYWLRSYVSFQPRDVFSELEEILLYSK